MKLILASHSPRRRELLSQAGFAFSTSPADIDETPAPQESPRTFVLRMALEKALTVASTAPRDSLILAADTIVVLGEAILGKPKDGADARRMLQNLSGQTHHVMTAYAIVTATHDVLLHQFDTTVIGFRALTSQEIDEYIQSGEPLDKAGAYAVQGQAKAFVTSLTGSLTNVIGLPIEKIEHFLKARLANSDK